MYKTIDYRDTLGECLFIDVRSPGEYEEATIPGAVNIPLFSDEERHTIGYVYVNESVERAKYMGIEAVSKKLPQIFMEVTKLKDKSKKLVFFCARGGMRSGSICALLNSIGEESFKLSGGYKGYRSFINEQLPKVNEGIAYVVLHGKTGCGKTQMLRDLEEKGCDILDLEYAANHRGSLLGTVGLGRQRSQKAFESIIYESLKNRKSNLVIVEGESKRIGNVIVPDYIFKSMEKGIHVLVEGSMEYRKNIIITEYTRYGSSKSEILEGLECLKRYISSERIDGFKRSICSEDFESVAEDLMLKYYDPMYMNEIKKYSYGLVLDKDDIGENSSALEQWYKNFLISGGQLDEC
ncbi:MAG: tRNA 2-selenouridine(34) synthase MnmH [Bacillota bacterium]|nr:tRNA 2-selenouridine(34) synthase MnmH [Bacillota bacterium]